MKAFLRRFFQPGLIGLRSWCESDGLYYVHPNHVASVTPECPGMSKITLATGQELMVSGSPRHINDLLACQTTVLPSWCHKNGGGRG